MTMIDPGVNLETQPQAGVIEAVNNYGEGPTFAPELGEGLLELGEQELAQLEWDNHVRSELGAVAGQGSVVVDYAVEGWRKSGSYGLLWELEGKTITITTLNTDSSNGGTADSILHIHRKAEETTDPKVLDYLNSLALLTRPPRIKPVAVWQRDL